VRALAAIRCIGAGDECCCWIWSKGNWRRRGGHWVCQLTSVNGSATPTCNDGTSFVVDYTLLTKTYRVLKYQQHAAGDVRSTLLQSVRRIILLLCSLIAYRFFPYLTTRGGGDITIIMSEWVR
jgi:hypothetical protein